MTQKSPPKKNPPNDITQSAEHWQKLSWVLKTAAKIQELKNEDYGNVPGGRDAYFPFGHYSYMQMLHIKYMRLQSSLNNMQKGIEPNFEGILDTLIDLINYATYYAETFVITLKDEKDE